jgi:hypothetical protein
LVVIVDLSPTRMGPVWRRTLLLSMVAARTSLRSRGVMS